MMMKLIRLGYSLDFWKGAKDGNLYVTVMHPQCKVDESMDPDGEVLLCCEEVDVLPGFEAQASIDERLKKYCLESGI